MHCAGSRSPRSRPPSRFTPSWRLARGRSPSAPMPARLLCWGALDVWPSGAMPRSSMRCCRRRVLRLAPRRRRRWAMWALRWSRRASAPVCLCSRRRLHDIIFASLQCLHCTCTLYILYFVYIIYLDISNRAKEQYCQRTRVRASCASGGSSRAVEADYGMVRRPDVSWTVTSTCHLPPRSLPPLFPRHGWGFPGQKLPPSHRPRRKIGHVSRIKDL